MIKKQNNSIITEIYANLHIFYKTYGLSMRLPVLI